MTHSAPSTPPPATPPTPPEQPPTAPKRPRGVVIAMGILIAVVITYGLALFGFYLLAQSSAPLPKVEHEPGDDTVVSLRLDKLDTVANRLTVKVLVIPQKSDYNEQLRVLKDDSSVRLYPENESGDLSYPAGKAPAVVATTLETHGKAGNWPFDSYSTDVISAEVLVGKGDARKYVPARVEVEGYLDGWDVSVQRVHDPDDTENPNSTDAAIITLHRSKGTLIFDAGICLVLFALPALALTIAILMLTGKRGFLPPFVTWFAAVLFAVIPIRNFLPGNPPAGAWIDQALVLWVLIALVVAMIIYFITWYRRTD